MDVVKFAEAEVANPVDFEKISTAARDGVDDVSVGGLGWPAHYSHCRVETTASANVVRVTPGEHHASGIIYRAEVAIDLDLQAHKPILTSDQIWVAILLSGQIEEVIENRAFETGPEPLNESVVVSQPTPVTEKRSVRVSPQIGTAGPVPVKPAIAEGNCCVAFVLLDTTGVVSIEPNDGARVKTVYEIEKRLTIVEVALDSLTNVTGTLQTDLAGVAAQVERAPSWWLIEQLAKDVARTNQLLDVPDDAHNYRFDQGLIPDFWDLSHVDAQFRVFEGIWPSYQEKSTEQLRLADLNNPDVVQYGNILLPAHDVTYRDVVPKGSATENISNVINTIKTARQVTESHTSKSYGATFRVCENTAGWGALGSVRAQQTFAREGQTFQSLGQSDIAWNSDSRSEGHKNYNVRQVYTRSYTTSYTVYDTKEVGLSGAMYFQTWPSSQLAVNLGISLYFNRVGSVGDVTLCICEVHPTGLPNFDRIIKTSTVAVDDLDVGWVDFRMDPWVRQPGKRYAWFTVTSGNHEIAKTTDNSYPQGTAGKSVDGVWAQGTIMEDYSFREIVATNFASRTEVVFEPLALNGGMTELHLIYQSVEEGQSGIVWEALPYQGDEWILIDDDEDALAFASRPPQMTLRATFVGTPDIAPLLVMGQDCRCTVGRMYSEMRAISNEIDWEQPTTAASILVNMDAFDADHHTCTPKIILPGGTVQLADSITPEPDPSKPTRTRFRADFTFGSAITACAIRIDTTTDTVMSVPFIQDVHINAF